MHCFKLKLDLELLGCRNFFDLVTLKIDFSVLPLATWNYTVKLKFIDVTNKIEKQRVFCYSSSIFVFLIKNRIENCK